MGCFIIVIYLLFRCTIYHHTVSTQDSRKGPVMAVNLTFSFQKMGNSVTLSTSSSFTFKSHVLVSQHFRFSFCLSFAFRNTIKTLAIWLLSPLSILSHEELWNSIYIVLFVCLFSKWSENLTKMNQAAVFLNSLVMDNCIPPSPQKGKHMHEADFLRQRLLEVPWSGRCNFIYM